MKITRTFKGSWFGWSVVVSIIIGELVAWTISRNFGVRLNGLPVAFASAGLVALVEAALFEDWE